MKKRMFSLKRQILTISLAFSVIVVLLLVTLLINMVISWQEKTRKNRTDGLLSYEETLETSYSQLNQIVKEIYSENSDFSGLGHFPSAGKRWTNLYNLMNLMKIQTKVYQGIEGLFVFYDGYEHMQYAVNQTLSFSETEQLKKDGQQTLRTSGQVSVDYVSSSEEVKWYNLFLKKNNAAIGGCISLTEGLPEEKEAGAIYGVVFEGTFYQIWPKEDPIEKSSPGAGAFSEKTAGIDYNSLETGENRENDRMIWLQKAGNANLAVVEILPVSLWLYVNKLHLFFLMLILLFIICLIRIEKAVYYELFRPLENMTDTLRNIQAGQWEIDFSVPNRVMEIEDVRESIKLLLAEVEHYKIRFYEEELEKARIQRQYLQIIVGTIFSLTLDFSMMLVSFLNPADYLSQFATLLLSCVVVAFGVMLEVQTEVVYLPPDGIIVAISKVLKKEFPKVKPFVDTSFVLTAAILSIVFLGYLAGVREGTIVSALIIGPIVKVLQTYLNPYVERLYEK